MRTRNQISSFQLAANLPASDPKPTRLVFLERAAFGRILSGGGGVAGAAARHVRRPYQSGGLPSDYKG